MLFGLRCGSPSRTLIVLYLLSAGCVLLFTVVGTAPLALGLSLAAGFAFGPVWPMLLGTGTANFPDSSGTASGIMMAFSGLGGTVASVLLGWIADRTDVRMSMLALGVLSLLGAGSCMAGIRILSGRRTGR